MAQFQDDDGVTDFIDDQFRSFFVDDEGNTTYGAIPMNIFLGDRVLDYGLNAFQDCDAIYVCNNRPTTYAQASSDYALGSKSFTAGTAFSEPDVVSGDTGRAVISTEIGLTDADLGTIATGGALSFWAAVDVANGRFLASGSVSNAQVVVAGQKFKLAPFMVHLRSQFEEPVTERQSLIISSSAMEGMIYLNEGGATKIATAAGPAYVNEG